MEIWKPIPNFDGLYDASNLGNIRSSPNKTTSNSRYSERKWKSRILKPKHPTNKKRQDYRVTLWKDGIGKDYLVARLVALAWHGIPSEGMTVNHINGDWKDNRATNLEWVSLTDNIRHGWENGLYQSCKKSGWLIDCNGFEIHFESKSAASRYLNRIDGYVSNQTQSGQIIYASDGSIYSWRSD